MPQLQFRHEPTMGYQVTATVDTDAERPIAEKIRDAQADCGIEPISDPRHVEITINDISWDSPRTITLRMDTAIEFATWIREDVPREP